jgi:F0F1-type ATP synthase assembly protein I
MPSTFASAVFSAWRIVVASWKCSRSVSRTIGALSVGLPTDVTMICAP